MRLKASLGQDLSGKVAAIHGSVHPNDSARLLALVLQAYEAVDDTIAGALEVWNISSDDDGAMNVSFTSIGLSGERGAWLSHRVDTGYVVLSLQGMRCWHSMIAWFESGLDFEKELRLWDEIGGVSLKTMPVHTALEEKAVFDRVRASAHAARNLHDWFIGLCSLNVGHWAKGRSRPWIEHWLYVNGAYDTDRPPVDIPTEIEQFTVAAALGKTATYFRDPAFSARYASFLRQRE